MILRLLTLTIAMLALSSGVAAQLPPEIANPLFPTPATPLKWDWTKLRARNVYFYSVSNFDRPLILLLPSAPGNGGAGFIDHLSRYFYDQGYAIGFLDWRGDRARTQLPSKDASEAAEELAQVISLARDRGFDANRIVLVGNGESAFMSALLSADKDRLESTGILASTICATILIDPKNLDPARPDTYIAQRLFARESATTLASLAPLAYARTAPPTLFLTEVLDRGAAARVDRAQMALEAVGRVVVHDTYPRFVEKDEATYLGLQNNATNTIGKFLKTYCPSKLR